VIYFVQAESVGHIKIGWHAGTDAAERVRELQVGSPVKLTLLGTMPGEKETEADLHRKFSHAHLHGEWFRAVPELLALIGRQGEDWRRGSVEVQSRFVQIKVLTVGGRKFTKQLLAQLQKRDIINWQASSPERLVERGDPWGWIDTTEGYVLIWQRNSRLYRWPIPSDMYVQHHYKEYDLRETNPGAWREALTGYDPTWEATRARWLALDQLFIGVS
jgi:hypothetical protein